MVLSYLVLCLLSIATELRSYEGFYYRDATGIGHYGLEGLSMDILEKIKQASGHPISTNAFSNILSAQSQGFATVKFRPYKKSKLGKKGKKKDFKGSDYRFLGGEKSSHDKSARFSDTGKSGRSGKELWAGSYDESSGAKNDYMSESEFTDDHFHQEEGEKGNEFKGGHKHGRAFLSKGYEDVYHRDETKKADSFWDKEEKEGKWIKYGSRKRKHEKKGKKKKGEKKTKESKEGGDYKSSAGKESEKKDQMSAKKESKKTTKSEHSKKEIELTETKI